MKKQRIYDLVKELLTDYPELRDSDKKLIWAVWTELALVRRITSDYTLETGAMVSYDSFMEAPSTETIRRCRQSIQEHNPELRGSKWVQRARAEKAEEKGSFIYHEEVREQTKFI